MHTDTHHLKTLALEIAGRKNPDTLSEPKADHRLVLEVGRLEKAITDALRAFENFIQRDTFHNDTLGKLIDICDILYEPDHHITPDTQELLNLLSNIRRILPREISPLLRLPKAFVHQQKELIKADWLTFEDNLHKYQIDKDLIAIAAIPFQRFIDGKEKLYWGNYRWLKGYAAKLSAVDWDNADCHSKTEALMSLLIGRDFNHDQFFVYCKKYIVKRVKAFGTKKRCLQEYELCRTLILEDTEENISAFDRHASNLSGRLLKWIREETEAVKSCEFFDDEQYKVEYNWDVDSIALYHKYLMDKGITKKVNLELYSKQIAATVSSVGKEEFQWDTIYKRLYSKEQKVLKRIFGPLNAIVEEIKQFLRK